VKVLLDHCVNRRFAGLLAGHDVSHTSEFGWGDLQNGKLLDAAVDSGFEVIVTVDRNFRHQQNITVRSLSLITLEATGIDLRAISPLAGRVVATLDEGLRPGLAITISGEGVLP